MSKRRHGSLGRTAGAVTAAMVWSLLAVVGPAAAGTSLSVVVAAPPTLTVGDNTSAAITISNTSTPPESSGTLVLSSIAVVGACGTFAISECPEASVDVGVFLIVGASGSGGACQSIDFTVGTTTTPATPTSSST